MLHVTYCKTRMPWYNVNELLYWLPLYYSIIIFLFFMKKMPQGFDAHLTSSGRRKRTIYKNALSLEYYFDTAMLDADLNWIRLIEIHRCLNDAHAAISAKYDVTWAFRFSRARPDFTSRPLVTFIIPRADAIFDCHLLGARLIVPLPSYWLVKAILFYDAIDMDGKMTFYRRRYWPCYYLLAAMRAVRPVPARSPILSLNIIATPMMLRHLVSPVCRHGTMLWIIGAAELTVNILLLPRDIEYYAAAWISAIYIPILASSCCQEEKFLTGSAFT